MKDLRDPRDTLKSAVLLLEEYGWIQGRSGDCEQGFCALGAIACTAGEKNPWESDEAVALFRDYLPGRSYVSYWNDKLGRTKEEVIAVMMKAANS